MAKLIWNKLTDRTFESGIDRGVLYPGYNSGVSWPGLVSVSEKYDSETAPFYLDGIKYIEVPSFDEFSGTITAISYPKQFLEFEGISNVGSIVFIGQQNRKSFSFSYRTKVGNANAKDLKYKIHIVYNALVIPSDREYQTLSSDVALVNYSWEFTTTPIFIANSKPSSVISIDSANTAFITEVENILYGTSTTNPRLMEPNEIVSLFNSKTW